MSKQSLLLVDGDPRSMRVLEVSLKKAGFNVTTAVNGSDAMDKIGLALPDLILSETKLDVVDGFALCQKLKANPSWAGIPFVFLTAQTEIEHKIKGLELGCDDYLTKPIYIKEIVTRVRILLQKQQRSRLEQKREGRTRFTGKLSDMAVVDLIQTIELSRKSGVIQFHAEGGPDDGKIAAIYFRDGKVIDAEMGSLQGEDAVYRLLTWNDAEFEVVFRTVRRREVIEMSTQGLLMEGMRRLDEWGRLLEQLPNLDARFEVDVKELSGRLGEVPDEHNAILKLFDGRRSLMEVIDASAYGDLETLEVIAKLYFEGLLFEVSPPPRTKTPTEEWFPSKMLEATPADVSAVSPAVATEDSGPEPAPVPDSGPTGVPVTVDDDSEEPSAASAQGRLMDAAADGAPIVDPRVLGAATALIFDESFMGEDATPLPGPMVEPVDEGSGPKVIASLGADAATAFGEVHSDEFPLDEHSEPGRELLTIRPRRASRGVAAIDGRADDPLDDFSERVTGDIPIPRLAAEAAAHEARASRPTEPPAVRPRASSLDAAPPGAAAPEDGTPAHDASDDTPRLGSAVRLPARAPSVAGRDGAGDDARAAVDDDLLEPARGGRGWMVAVALAAVAIIGAIAIVVARGRSSGPADAGVAHRGHAADAARPTPTVVDAAVAMAPVDAGVPVVVDAAVAAVAVDAAVVAVAAADAAVDPADERKQKAKDLVRKARALVADDQEQAIALADESISVRRSPEAYYVKADALRRAGRVTDAIEALDRATDLNHRYADAWKMLGGLLRDEQRHTEAREAFRRYLELRPRSRDAEWMQKYIEGA